MKNDTNVTLSSVELSTVTGGGVVNTQTALSAMGVTEEDVIASQQAQRWTVPETYAHGADRAAAKIRENLAGSFNLGGTAVVDRFTSGWHF